MDPTKKAPPPPKPQEISRKYRAPTPIPASSLIAPGQVNDDMSLSSIWESNWNGTKQLIEGLGAMPGAIVRGAMEVPEAMQYIAKSFYQDPGGSVGPTWNVVREVIPFTGSQYRDAKGNWTLEAAGKGAIKNIPMAVLDALSVWGGVTGAAKSAAKAGLVKAAKGASEATKAAGLTNKSYRAALKVAGTAATPDLVELAKWEGRLSEAIKWQKAPAAYALAGINKIESLAPIAKIEDSLGIGKLGREVGETFGMHEVETMQEMAKLQREAWLKTLAPEKVKLYDRISRGADYVRKADWAPEEITRIRAEAEISREIERRFRELQIWNTSSGKPLHEVVEESRTENVAYAVRDRQVAIREGFADEHEMFDWVRKHDGTIGRMRSTPEELEKVKRIKALQEAPLSPTDIEFAKTRRMLNEVGASAEGTLDISEGMYRPIVSNNPLDIGKFFEDLFRPAQGKANQYAENLMSKRGTAIREYRPEIVDYHYMKSSAKLLAWGKAIKQIAGERALIRTGAEIASEGVPQGYKIMPFPVEQRLNDQLLANGVVMRLKGELDGLIPDTPEFAAGMERLIAKAGDELVDANVIERIEDLITTQDKILLVPDGTARALEQMLEPIGPWGRMADSALDYWREIVLSWSPRFYLNNLLGNAVLQTLYGIDSFNYSAKAQEGMSASVTRVGMAREATHLQIPGVTTGMKWVKRVQNDMSSLTDGVARRGVDRAAVLRIIQEKADLDVVGGFWKNLAAKGPDEVVKTVNRARETVREMSDIVGNYKTFDPETVQGINVGRTRKDPRYGTMSQAEAALGKAAERRLSRAEKLRESAGKRIGKSKEAEASDLAGLERERLEGSLGDYDQARFNTVSTAGSSPFDEMTPTELAEVFKNLGNSRDIINDAVAAKVRGAVQEGPELERMVEGATQRRGIEDKLASRVDALRQPTARERRLTINIQSKRGEIRLNMDQAKLMLDKMDELKELAKVSEQGLREVDRFLGAYNRSTPFARKYLRRIVPFWTFASTMHQLAFWMPLIRPGRTMAISRLAEFINDGLQDENLPEHLRGKAMIGTTRDGQAVFVNASGFNPFESVGFRTVGGVTIPKVMDPTQSPFVAMTMKALGSYDQFTHNPPPLQPGQVMDTLGRVWEFDPYKGKAVRVSPQTPLLDVAFDLVPQTHAVNDLLAWAGLGELPGRKTKVFYGADGKPVAPPTWYDGLMRAFGLQRTVVDLDATKRSHDYQTIRYLRLLAKQAMYERNPEVRAQTLSFISDAITTLRRKKEER